MTWKNLLFILTILSCQSSDPSNPISLSPNLILIMADDLGYEGLGCFENKEIKTPNLDMMAAQGLKFTDYHSNGSVCSPTRAALLTGRYQQRAGLEGVIYARGPTRQTGLDTNEVGIAKELQKLGYATMISGKWHLGYQKAFNPIHHGFDKFVGYVSGNIDFHSHFDGTGIYDWYHNLDTIKEEGYVTDLISGHAVNFIRENQDKPFFLYVPHEAPHVPFQGRNDPAYRFSDNEFSYYGPVQDRDRAYREMVEIMDEGIGSILGTLQELGLEENTLVVFISDNGGESFGHNGQLRGDKGSLFEGGHRVPAIASWKGKIRSGISDETIMSFDWTPTFLSLAGLSIDQFNFDGVDLSGHLLDGKDIDQRNLFWRYRGERVIRQGPMKLLLNEKDTFLFNLQEDLNEDENLWDGHPEHADDLIRQLAAWEKEIDLVEQKTK